MNDLDAPVWAEAGGSLILCRRLEGGGRGLEELSTAKEVNEA